MAADGGVLPNFRRNGQKPSCEPCRKSKYRCDHILPVCQRCQTRGMPDKCTYHPAPMKGRTISKSKKPARASPLLSPESHISKGGPTPTSNPPPRPRQDSVSSEPAEEYGFLGSTAYNAVFTDNQEHLTLHWNLAKPTESSNCNDPLACERQHRLLNLQMREALFVLQCLQDFPHLEKILERWSKFEQSCCLIGPWAEGCAKSIRKELYETNALKNEKTMLIAAEKLFANTESKIKVTKDLKFYELTKLYTGQNLRWEALGVFFTVIGLCMNDFDAPDNCFAFVGRKEESKQTLWDRVLRASNACVEFTDDVSNQSDLGLWTMLDNSILASQILGDAHYLVWRKVGDVSTAIYARGLHEQRENSNVPFWLQEMRNRALGYAYASDKTLCTFVGRPPRISQRYCTIKIPLDLEYEELALEGADLQNALSKIGPDGWNPDSFSISLCERTSFYQRPFVINALLREDTLELCLGPSGPNHREKVFDCIRRNQETYDSLPHAVQLSPESWLLHDKKISFPAARQFMDFLYNEFMLRRVLVRRYHVDPTELLQVAHKMLMAVIEARNIRGMHPISTSCMAWMLVLYGLPAAGVLAVELLQLNGKSLNHTKIKQDLCVITSYLRWIHVPGDGNYQLVEQARTTLQHILDKALMPEPVATPVQSGVLPETPISVGDHVPPAIDLSGQDFSWFDSAGQFDADFWASLMNVDQPINTQD